MKEKNFLQGLIDDIFLERDSQLTLSKCLSKKSSDKEGFPERDFQSTLSMCLSKKASEKEGFLERNVQLRDLPSIKKIMVSL